MIKNSYLKIFLALLFVFALPTNAVASDNIEQIVFFGDSLSDNGNLYAVNFGVLPESPPYYEGRFSNGPTWAELVAKHFSDTNKVGSENYAIGGETVLYHEPSKGYWPFVLTESLVDYGLHNPFNDKSHTLYVFLIGANDYLWGSDDADKETTDVTDALKTDIQTLIKTGGEHFLILNLPDLSSVPAARMVGGAEILHTLTVLHNSKLAAIVADIQQDHKDVAIKLYDYNALSDDLQKKTDAYNKKYNTHITNLTDACWTGGYKLSQIKSQENEIAKSLEKAFSVNGGDNKHKMLAGKINFQAMAHTIVSNPALATAYGVAKSHGDGEVPCADPDSYLFWDFVHPTQVAHQISAANIIEFMEQNFTF
jgi:phospholipase/lecithinase/hemolysin